MKRKAGFPYLVDIKITEKCPFGCIFCYTSSVNVGNEAKSWEIERLLRNLADIGVLEIAIGGGEPTLHPDILDILKKAKKLRFGTAVTTKNYNLDARILEETDSVAFSVFSTNDVDKINKSMVTTGRAKIYLQTILGAIPFEETLKLIKYIKSKNYYALTLLGYKNFGFGIKSLYYAPPSDWIDLIKNEFSSFGVDSIIVDRYRNELKKNGVKNIYLVGREGGETCYIDAVQQFMAPSSFTNSNKIDIKYAFEQIIKSNLTDGSINPLLGAFRSF